MEQNIRKKKVQTRQQSSSSIENSKDKISKENLKNNFANFESFRRSQDLSLQSVSEEKFTLSSCAEEMYTREETTGGNEIHTDEDKDASSVSSSMMTRMSASPIEKAMFSKQQQTQQCSVASSSTSLKTSVSMETIRKTKTLSFLHNEDLFGTGTTTIAGGNSSISSLRNDDILLPKTPHLFRSISFQEQRRHYNQKSPLQRTEPVKESGELSTYRKMAILSPKHSLQELHERIKQQQMRMQQPMFYESTEFSM